MTEVLVVAALIVSVASIVGTGVWAVSSIKGDTKLLRQSIDHLAEEVAALGIENKALDERSDDHEGRLIRLEAQPAGPGNRPA